MTDPVLTSALAAASRVGARLGLPTGAVSVLADGSNVLVTMGSVVARVATTTALVRPEVADWLARDVALARFAAGRGLPVVAPCAAPIAGPHEVDGLAITLWPFTPHRAEQVPAPDVVGTLLLELHQALRGFPGEVPAGGPLTEIGRMLALLDTGGLRAEDLKLLRSRAEDDVERARLAAAEWPAQVLHGDPHPGKLLVTPDGPRWIDFEDTWFGPVAWDLACLARTTRLDGRAALATYPGAPPLDALEPFLALRDLQGVCWTLILARRSPAHRPRARALLEAYLR